MTKLKKIGLSLSGLASLYIAYITGTGDILNYINFAGPLNEMAFCICALIISIMCFISAFSSDSIPCSKELDMEWANESENIQ
tara:strand:+ start:317 stop:565 length:249 start_codon:yes stop_codon:yes gene_type:complete